MALARCACGGFLPASADTCPHCQANVARPMLERLRLGALCGVIGGSTIAFTLMACYGVAPGTVDCLDCDPPDAGQDANPDGAK